MSSRTADLPHAGAPGLAEADIQRRRLLLARWRRHSALIHVLRKVLPALCAMILTGVGAVAVVNTLLLRNDGKVQGGPEIRMLNPNFQGRTEAGKPYVVQAASAVRANGDNAKVTLERPVFTLGPPDNRTVVRAQHGVYREDTRMLDLRGDVHLDDTKGNHLVTEHALVDTHKSDVSGETRIVGGGPLGRIDASSYAVLNAGAEAHFAGHVKSRIEHRSSFVAAPAVPPAK